MDINNLHNIPPQRRSQLAQKLLHLDGAPFSLNDYPFLVDVYDGCYQGMLLKFGRQSAKSTTLCNFIICESVGIPHFRNLYISPSQEQTQTFSNTRIGKTVYYSPLVRKYWSTSDFTHRTMLRMFRNGSEIKFTYAQDDPDRARGNTADRVNFDEVQDILYDEVIPVVNECFDTNTEVLTRTGWKLVRDVTYDDELADTDEDGIIHWHKPTEIIQTTHTGNMYTFIHQGMRLRVTDRHLMWAHLHGETRYLHKGQYIFITAKDLWNIPGESFRFTGPTATLASVVPSHKHFVGIPEAHGANRNGITVPYEALAQLVGWYLAEGSIIWVRRKSKRCCPHPCIVQNEGRYLDKILQTIKACGLSYCINSHSKKPHCKCIVINSRLLGEYLLPLGKTADKYIPEEFFQYPRLLELLLEALYLGDAAATKATWDSWMYYTTSKQLAEGVHRAWTLLGRSPRLRQRKTLTTTGLSQYEVCAYKKNFHIFYRRDAEKRLHVEHVEKEPVYCFTLPYHRPVIRGGFGLRPIITGQCMGNSNYGYETYAGTPKTMENTIEYLWSISTRTEWIMQCEGCNKWNFIESEKSIGKIGPICLNCGHLLNPRDGQWYDFNPNSSLKGFHVAQPILPLNSEDPQRWARILSKLERYSETKLKNEVFGVSDALGARLISKEELYALCRTYDIYRTPPRNMEIFSHIVAGVDWSGGGTEGISRTVLWIFGITAIHQLKTLFFRIYPVTNPVSIVDDVAEILTNYNVALTVGDRGEGHLANNQLKQKLGRHRVTQVKYGAQAAPIVWNEDADSYHADRTTLMDNYFMILKRGGVIYPNESYMDVPIQDTLNIYEEVTQNGLKVWRHAPTKPDDAFHAQLFGWIAAKIVLMDMEFAG